MGRRKLIWHIGVADPPREIVGANLQAHRARLAESGFEVVASADEAVRAAHEVRRSHRQAGLSSLDVEGRWARICARVWKHRGVSLLSTPAVCAADKDRIRFALDQLGGIEVHLVLSLDSISQQLYGGWLAELRRGRSPGWDTYVQRVVAEERGHRQAEEFWSGHEIEQILSRWGWTLHPDRLHVIAEPSVESQWAAFLDIAGATEQLDPVVPPYADPAGVVVLRKVNRQLDEPVSEPAYLLSRGEPERTAMPVVATPGLDPLIARWAASIGAAGHDLRGSLAGLSEPALTTDLPGARDQLGSAVEALSDALAENSRLRALVGTLEADRDRLDRKRRKLKRRLAGRAGN